ncbi:MAG TPA: hypothetical protein GXX20_09620 [Clostridiaceae bacterium]|nr:hypothetical protein [Clostridiaceae bacterium]
MFLKRYKNKKKCKFGNLLHVGTMCVVLIGALSLLGISYSSWSQSFSIFGSISTGEINLVVKDVVLDSSDSYDSLNFNVNKTGNIVDSVNMEVVSGSNPFNTVLVFTVENSGTIPVACEGIDTDAPGSVDVQLLESPERIYPGESAQIKIKIAKGYVNNFEFSTFLRFAQKI